MWRIWGQKNLVVVIAFGQRTITLRLGETHLADYPTPKGDHGLSRLVKDRSGGVH
ncbi:MAG: hypothetical protein JSV89_12250 [Spirochaetaceae bacterium]|nr:MAG: hypothetical protein JSV89_12250 [Spirochaetaceae bacterium]